jgi:hypothetical protein
VPDFPVRGQIVRADEVAGIVAGIYVALRHKFVDVDLACGFRATFSSSSFDTSM